MLFIQSLHQLTTLCHSESWYFSIISETVDLLQVDEILFISPKGLAVQ